MNCQEFDAIVLDLVRGNLKATAAAGTAWPTHRIAVGVSNGFPRNVF